MKKSTSINNSLIWVSDLGNGNYRNPILFADYSDLDIIRVGEDFYMTASSFVSTPGLPILHSKDMVNWSIIGHAVDKLPIGYEDKVRHSEGIWAPSIRFYDDMFWIFVSMPDDGIFMTKASNPAGPWSDLHLVKEVKGWIDPCPMWDEFGQAYLIHAYAYSRCGFNSKLNICRMNIEGTALLDDGIIVFDGTDNQPTIEGPKLYKRNGYYYIFAPAGGVATGWQTVLRSKQIMGPYEYKIVMHQGDTTVNGPHQGGYVELESGESWFAHFQDRGAYGRIVHLQPMTWENDWPIIGVDTNRDGIGEPVLVYKKPDVGKKELPICVPETGDEFDGKRLGHQWQWQGNSKAQWYSLDANPGHLRLYANKETSTFFEAPQILCQKFPAPQFTATTMLKVPIDVGACFRAGMTVFGYEYAYLAVERSESHNRLVLVNGKGGKDYFEEIVAETEIETAFEKHIQSVYLQVKVAAEAQCTFHYSIDGVTYQQFGNTFTAVPGGWVGAKLGLFCLRTGTKQTDNYTDFDWFRIQE